MNSCEHLTVASRVLLGPSIQHTLMSQAHKLVYSNREARKHLAESNGTPAMDCGFEERKKERKKDIRKRRYTDKRGKEQNTRP